MRLVELTSAWEMSSAALMPKTSVRLYHCCVRRLALRRFGYRNDRNRIICDSGSTRLNPWLRQPPHLILHHHLLVLPLVLQFTPPPSFQRLQLPRQMSLQGPVRVYVPIAGTRAGSLKFGFGFLCQSFLLWSISWSSCFLVSGFSFLIIIIPLFPSN